MTNVELILHKRNTATSHNNFLSNILSHH